MSPPNPVYTPIDLTSIKPDEAMLEPTHLRLGGLEKRRYLAVLHEGPVDSPEAAARSAIVQELKDV